MAYTINKTDGSLYATVADGTLDSTTSLRLVGRNFANYGEVQNENYFRLLESHANTIPPSNPQKGQLWFDSVNSVLNVYTNGTTAKPLSLQETSLTEPTSGQIGDTWYDTTTKQLNVYNGTSFDLVGPDYTETQGVSGAVVETITSGGGAVDHVITKLYVGTVLMAIMSTGITFTPDVAIPGFATLNPGIQLATGESALYYGTAQNTLFFNGQLPTDFLSTINDDVTAGTIKIQNDGGLAIGVLDQLQLTVNGTEATMANTNLNADLHLSVNNGGSQVNALTVEGGTGRVNVPDFPVDPNNIINLFSLQAFLAGYTLKAGDTMTGPLIMGAVGANVQASTSNTFSTLSYTFASDTNTGILGDNADGMHLVTAGLPRLFITPTGKLTAETTNYETLVTADDDIPNKKYVDDLVANTASIVTPDFPAVIGLTVRSGTNSAWQLISVNAAAKFAFVSYEAYGIFGSGGGFVRVYARRPAISGAAAERWLVGAIGASTGLGGAEAASSSGGAIPVECDALGRIEVYCHSTSTGTIAPYGHVILKGWTV